MAQAPISSKTAIAVSPALNTSNRASSARASRSRRAVLPSVTNQASTEVAASEEIWVDESFMQATHAPIFRHPSTAMFALPCTGYSPRWEEAATVLTRNHRHQAENVRLSMQSPRSCQEDATGCRRLGVWRSPIHRLCTARPHDRPSAQPIVHMVALRDAVLPLRGPPCYAGCHS